MIKITRYPSLLFLISGFMAFQPALSNRYSHDDVPQVADLKVPVNLHEWISVPGQTWWPGSHQKNIWRPLTRTTILVQKAIHPGQTWAFYLINLLLHALAGFLLYRLALKLGLNESCALWGSLIFTVHPVHSEAIHQVVGRAEILAGCWMLLGCLYYSTNTGNRQNLWVQPVCYALALCSKESAVIYPLLIVLIYLKLATGNRQAAGLLSGRIIRKEFRGLLPVMIVVLGIFLGCKHAVSGGWIEPASSVPGHENILAQYPVTDRLPAVLGIFGYACSRLIMPIQLAPDYSSISLPLDAGWDWGWSWTGLVLILFISAWCLVDACRRRTGWMLCLAGFVPWLLTSNLFFVIGVSTAERLWYFPSASACLGLGWFISRLFNQPDHVLYRFRVGALSILVILLVSASWNYASAWRNPYQLARWTVDRFPDSWRGNINLSREYYHLRDFGPGLIHARTAVDLLPGHALGWDWIGLNATFIPDRRDEADKAFIKALELDPGLNEIHRHRANLLQIQKRPAEASIELQKYLSHPDIPDREEVSRRLFELTRDGGSAQ
jgi:hypothetical protein